MERLQLLKNRIEEVEVSLDDMNIAEGLAKFIGGRSASTGRVLEQLRSAYTTTMESERKIIKGFHSLIESVEKTRKELDGHGSTQESDQTLVYWEDEIGLHSFVSGQLQLTWFQSCFDQLT